MMRRLFLWLALAGSIGTVCLIGTRWRYWTSFTEEPYRRGELHEPKTSEPQKAVRIRSLPLVKVSGKPEKLSGKSGLDYVQIFRLKESSNIFKISLVDSFLPADLPQKINLDTNRSYSFSILTSDRSSYYAIGNHYSVSGNAIIKIDQEGQTLFDRQFCDRPEYRGNPTFRSETFPHYMHTSFGGGCAGLEFARPDFYCPLCEEAYQLYLKGKGWNPRAGY